MSSGPHAHSEAVPPTLDLHAGVTHEWGGQEWINPFAPRLCLHAKGAHEQGPHANRKRMPPPWFAWREDMEAAPSICVQRG